MSALFAGIDGGQSSTVAVIGDERGRIVARGTAGPADEVGADDNSTRLRDALRDALADACRRANLPYESDFRAIVAGVSGYEGRVRGAQPELPSSRLSLLHDAPVAHAGAFAGGAGVIVLAGTGSVVYARDERGAARTLGGWGFLFGDEGSAFRIAADAISALMRAADDNDDSLEGELRIAREFFAMDSLREIARAFYTGELTRDRTAAFAPVALRLPAFRSVADRGADRLAVLALRALNGVVPARVALVGGLFADPVFYQRVRAGILGSQPSAHVVEARYEPAAGALLLAYRTLGIAPDALQE